MKTLLLMRHGKSSWKQSNLPDSERPLKKRGVKDARNMGELLLEKKHVPDMILCSSAVRCRMTAEKVIEASGFKNKVEYLDSLYQIEPANYIQILKTVPDDAKSVMIIGHNPSLEGFLQILCREIEALPTASIAHINLQIDHWTDLNGDSVGQLKNLWRPRDA